MTKSEDGKMTSEEARAIVREIWGPKPKHKPKVVVSEGKEVRDAVVRVAPSDPNYPQSDEGVVKVRRPGFVTINMEAWEEQQRQKRMDRMRRREIDPFRMGHWDHDWPGLP